MSSDRERRLRTAPLAHRVTWPIRRAQIAAIVVAVPAGLTVSLLTADLPTAARFALSMLVYLAVALATFVVALGPRTRAALEAFVWIGEHDLDRFIRDTGSPPPTSVRSARRWLEAHPDAAGTDLHRVDVLIVVGELEEADAVARRMPEGTPRERFERSLQLAYVGRTAGEDVDIALLSGLASALDDHGERHVAAAAVATLDAGRAALAGEDWREPLVEARRRLGPGATRTVLRSRLLRGVGIVLGTAGLLVVGLPLLWA